MRATDIADKNDVHTLLVNRIGHILWRGTGSYSDEKGKSLRAAIAANS